MEENNNDYQNIQTDNISTEQKNRHVCFENHCWKKCLGAVIAAFIGGFLAVYFIADQMVQHNYKMMLQHPQKFEKKLFNDVDKLYRRELKHFDDFFYNPRQDFAFAEFDDDFAKLPLFMNDSVKVNTSYDSDKFNVIIGLKPFNGDENKINYNVAGRKLTVFGKSKVQDDNFEQDIAFSQDFFLPQNADILKISKVKKGNKLIISVPLKK